LVASFKIKHYKILRHDYCTLATYIETYLTIIQSLRLDAVGYVEKLLITATVTTDHEKCCPD